MGSVQTGMDLLLGRVARKLYQRGWTWLRSAYLLKLTHRGGSDAQIIVLGNVVYIESIA